MTDSVYHNLVDFINEHFFQLTFGCLQAEQDSKHLEDSSFWSLTDFISVRDFGWLRGLVWITYSEINNFENRLIGRTSNTRWRFRLTSRENHPKNALRAITYIWWVSSCVLWKLKIKHISRLEKLISATICGSEKELFDI